MDGADMLTHILVNVLSEAELREREAMFPKQKPPGLSLQERVIYNMLTEPTAHILDSGGAFGRGWERWRRVVDPRQTPKAELRERVFYKDTVVTGKVFYTKDIDVSLSTFHYLNDNFVYLPGVDKEFRKLDAQMGKKEKWSNVIYEYAERKGMDVVSVMNTYNDEYDNVSNILQLYVLVGDMDTDDWLYAEPDDDIVIFIQTHNGCDVRGGYSTPHPFKPKSEELSTVLYNYRQEATITLYRNDTDVASFLWAPHYFEVQGYIKDEGKQFREFFEDLESRSAYDKDPGSQWEVFLKALRWNTKKERFYIRLSGKTYYLRAFAPWE